MWHTREVSKILFEILNKYGIDVFDSRKKCVALCGDLMSKLPKEQNILQMLFQAGLGETFNSVPFSSVQELNMGFVNIEKFLDAKAIDANVKTDILDTIQEAFVDRSAEIQLFVPQIVHNYNDCHFKMTIPNVTFHLDDVSFSFDFMSKSNGEDIATVLEKCIITDRVGCIYESDKDYSIFDCGKKKSNGFVSVPFDGKKIFLAGAIVEFVFLCTNNRKIKTVYISDSTNKLRLKEIVIIEETKYQLEKANAIIKSFSVESSNNTKNGNDDAFLEPIVFNSPEIDELSSALGKEIFFLKQGKGKAYKVVNGQRINVVNGIYTYSFEMETELYLPDDAPVIIDTSSGYHAEGTVLVCDDFSILLLLNKDLGDKVLSAHLMVEPWKLLEGLQKKMNNLDENKNFLAIKLIEEGPAKSTLEDINSIPKGQDKVIEKLEDEDIVTVWGPPGTGKTYTMAKIANDYLKNGKSVLIVSHSNVSVDGVVKKVVDLLEPNMEQHLKKGNILRFGYVRDEELSKHPYATSFNYALSNNPTLNNELNILSKKREELKAKKMTKSAVYDDVEKKIKHIRSQIQKEERQFVSKAKIIGTTISRATIDPMFDERQFDLVMFDEVSMAYISQVIVAASLSRDKFMCVGDFRQLPPIAQSPNVKKILETDIFSFLKIADDKGNIHMHPWLVMLNEQRRMHPDISAFPNKYVYKNLLKNHPSVIENRNDIVDSEPLSGDAVNLIDLYGTYCAASKNNDNSRFNIVSAIVSFATALEAQNNGIDSVGIITPYAAQTRLIRAMLKDYFGYAKANISCATVHQFQGSESDALIFDAVESYPTNKAGYLMSKEMAKVIRLINVAITRAKGKLITVGNARFWEDNFKEKNHIFYKLLKYTKESHNVISNEEHNIKQYIEVVNPQKLIDIHTDDDSAIRLFESDILKAKSKVVVSIPDSELKDTSDKIFEIINNAHSRGIDILMKSNEYKNLPDKWKVFCKGTENATFPLIVIDDEIVWYGLPQSKLKFTVNKTTTSTKTYTTVVPLMIRIKGKNTVEMLKSLTDIDYIQVGLIKKLLTGTGAPVVKKTPIGVTLVKSKSLSDFIEEKMYCSKCQNHMYLAKNKKGTSYLRCSNKSCDNMEWLTKETINWHLTSNNVSCPHGDNGTLYAGLGKFGPYIRCSCGHYIKPEEI